MDTDPQWAGLEKKIRVYQKSVSISVDLRLMIVIVANDAYAVEAVY